MQPQETPAPPSPNPDYDFILKDQPKPKQSFNIPSFGLPKKAFTILAGIVVVFLIVIVAAAILKGGGSSVSMIGVLGRAQEIARVSKLVEPLAQTADTKGLVATVEATFASQQKEILTYLARANTKFDKKTHALYQHKNTDAQMQTASQTNNLDTAYASYLKNSLTDYQNTLQAAAKGASKIRLQVLQDAFASTKTLLSAPQIANATP